MQQLGAACTTMKKMITKTEHITTYNTDNDEIDGMEMHISINGT
jgi:hypothetical protein